LSHFAKIENNVVTEVINAEAYFINSLPDKEKWKQTSYNTRAGVHYGNDGLPDNGVALRKNYAAIGFTYDAVLDAFIPPTPVHNELPDANWVLNETTCQWEWDTNNVIPSKEGFVWSDTYLMYLELDENGTGIVPPEYL